MLSLTTGIVVTLLVLAASSCVVAQQPANFSGVCTQTYLQYMASGNIYGLPSTNGNLGQYGSCRSLHQVFADLEKPAHFCGVYQVVSCDGVYFATTGPTPSLGLCLPALCNSTVLDTQLPRIHDLPVFVLNVMCPQGRSMTYTLTSYCEDEKLAFSNDKGAQAFLGVMCTLALAVLVSKLVLIWRKRQAWFEPEQKGYKPLLHPASGDPTAPGGGENDSRTPAADHDHGAVQGEEKQTGNTRRMTHSPSEALLTAFDLATTWRALLKQNRKLDTNFLNGMRVLSILWVILGHTVFFSSKAPGFTNMYFVLHERVASYRFLLVNSATYAVDTFFFLSGFLFVFLFLKRSAGVVHLSRFPLLLVHRILRLVPSMATVIFFAWTTVRHLGSGPLHRFAEVAFVESCRKHWWENLLFVNNLWPSSMSEECMPWFWYLGVQHQLFLCALLLFVAVKFYSPARYMLATTAVVLAACLNTTTHAINDGNSYIKPWLRGAPYFYGVLTAFLLRDIRLNKPRVQWLRKPTARVALLIASCVCLVSCVHLTWDYTTDEVMGEKNSVVASLMVAGAAFGFDFDPWRRPLHKLYAFACEFFWGLGLLCLILPFALGDGGLVKAFLAHPLWTPFARLSFNAYLLHPVLIILCNSMSHTAIAYTDTWYVLSFLGYAGLAFASALVVFVLVERPCVYLNELLVRRAKR